MPVKFFSSPRLLVEPLGVAFLRYVERRVHEHLAEFARHDQSARHSAFGGERRNKRHQNDQARIHHQPRDFGDTADILHAAGFGEAQILVARCHRRRSGRIP